MAIEPVVFCREVRKWESFRSSSFFSFQKKIAIICIVHYKRFDNENISLEGYRHVTVVQENYIVFEQVPRAY